MPPTVVMRPQTAPRAQGRPRPLRTPSSDIASAKPMLIPAPTEAAMPTRKASLLVCVAKAAAKDGRERRDGAVHQSSEAGLDNLEHEAATLGLVFLVACAGSLLLL